MIETQLELPKRDICALMIADFNTIIETNSRYESFGTKNQISNAFLQSSKQSIKFNLYFILSKQMMRCFYIYFGMKIVGRTKQEKKTKIHLWSYSNFCVKDSFVNLYQLVFTLIGSTFDYQLILTDYGVRSISKQ